MRGVKKTYPGQDLQECGQLRQSMDALNRRRTVNHWLEGLVKLHSTGSMSFMVILFQRPWKQSIKSLLRPLPARGSECNTNQWERKSLWLVLEDRWYYVCVLVCVCVRMDKIILSIRVLFEVGGLDGSSKRHVAFINLWQWRKDTNIPWPLFLTVTNY